jgi:hypothetical protein
LQGTCRVGDAQERGVKSCFDNALSKTNFSWEKLCGSPTVSPADSRCRRFDGRHRSGRAEQAHSHVSGQAGIPLTF